MTTDPTRRRLHIAFAIDERYLPWCATSALSCADHRGDSDLHVHVLHDGTLTRHRGAAGMESLLADQGVPMTWHGLDDPRVADLPPLDRFGRVVWLRFLLPEILDDVSRALYLDADTLVTDDLGPLLDTDLGGSPVGAVTNVVEPVHHDRLRALGVDPLDALNSGVLLLDLELMRQEGTSDQLLRTAEEFSDELRWPDQDTLNIALRGRWRHLHPRWNAQNSFWDWRPLALEVIERTALDAATTAPGIVHFEGPSLCKPWHALSVHPWRERYWETVRRTPWAATPPEDLTWATRTIRHLPRELRVRSYFRLVRWRERRGADAVAGGMT